MVNTLVASHKIPKKMAAEWERLNPIIFEKELIAVETTNTGIRFKIGDGVRRYNQLPFIDEALYSTLSAKADRSYVEQLIGTVDVSSQIEEHNTSVEAHSELFDEKVDKVEGKGLSSNDYTDEDKSKVDSALQESDLEGYATEDYVNDVISNIPIPDVSEQINEHNNSENAHIELFDNKVDKIDGMGLSSNDFTDELKDKLINLSEGGGGTPYTQAEILKLLVETDMIPTIITEGGEILIDNNNVVIIY